jgi:hypothetical protein
VAGGVSKVSYSTHNAGSFPFVWLAALSYYYCFTVVGGMSNERFAQRYEPFFHTAIVVIAVAAAIPGLVLDLLNPKSSGLGCWVLNYPPDCQEEGATEECERGGTAATQIVQLLTSIMPFSFSILSMVINNIILYVNMRRLEARNRRYTSQFQRAGTATAAAPPINNKIDDNNNKTTPGPWHRLSLAALRSSAAKAGLFRASVATSGTTTTSTSANRPPPPVSRRMAVQSFCYVGAFWMSYGWGSASFIVIAARSGKPNYFVLEAINFFFYPAQGFLNAVVYLRPNYLRWRDGGDSRIDAIRHALFSLKAPRRRRPGQQQQQQRQQRRPTTVPLRTATLPRDITHCSNTESERVHHQGIEATPHEEEEEKDDDYFKEVSLVSSDDSSSYEDDDDVRDPIVNAKGGEPTSESTHE